jgi:hypothetical protein
MKFLYLVDNILVGRYDTDINKEVPEGAIEVSEELYEKTSDNEFDWYAEEGDFKSKPKKSESLSREQIEELRLKSYADPVKGSDRYFSEVLSLKAQGIAESTDQVKALKAKALAVKEEIKAKYPWPI